MKQKSAVWQILKFLIPQTQMLHGTGIFTYIWQKWSIWERNRFGNFLGAERPHCRRSKRLLVVTMVVPWVVPLPSNSGKMKVFRDFLLNIMLSKNPGGDYWEGVLAPNYP